MNVLYEPDEVSKYDHQLFTNIFMEKPSQEWIFCDQDTQNIHNSDKLLSQQRPVQLHDKFRHLLCVSKSEKRFEFDLRNRCLYEFTLFYVTYSLLDKVMSYNQ